MKPRMRLQRSSFHYLRLSVLTRRAARRAARRAVRNVNNRQPAGEADGDDQLPLAKPNYLPEIGDVLTLTMCKLPVKSLVRFRALSKSVDFTIDHHQFARLHLDTVRPDEDLNKLIVFRPNYLFKHNPSSFDGICVLSSVNGTLLRYLSFAEHFNADILPQPISVNVGDWGTVPDTRYFISSSLDGLILIEAVKLAYYPRGETCFIFEMSRELFALNPSSRKVVSIPPLPLEDTQSLYPFGLGYEEANGYQVVCFVMASSPPSDPAVIGRGELMDSPLSGLSRIAAISVYCLGTGWTMYRVEEENARTICPTKEPTVCIDSTVYGITRQSIGGHECLISFDLREHVLALVPLPHQLGIARNVFLARLHNELAVVIEQSLSVVEIQMFQQGSWQPRYNIQKTARGRAIYLSNSGVLYLQDGFATSMVSFDLETPDVHAHLTGWPIEDDSYVTHHTGPYIESLASL